MLSRIVMHIRTGLLCTSLMCALPAFSGTMGAVVLPYNGLYIAGDIGVANLLDKESTLFAPDSYDVHQLSSTGFVGGGMIGYDYSVTEKVRFGVEGFINAAALNVAAEQQYGTYPSYRANMRYDAGVRILPGYEFTPGTVGHVLLGYAYGKFNIKDNGDYGYIDKGISANGFQAGLGMVVPCYFQNLSLRGDALYSTYGSHTSAGLSSTLAPLNYNNNFATIEGNLALVYKFL